MPVGGFHAIPKRVHHYGMAKGQDHHQLHGVGPWGITYREPVDDPSKKAARIPSRHFKKSRNAKARRVVQRARQQVQSTQIRHLRMSRITCGLSELNRRGAGTESPAQRRAPRSSRREHAACLRARHRRNLADDGDRRAGTLALH